MKSYNMIGRSWLDEIISPYFVTRISTLFNNTTLQEKAGYWCSWLQMEIFEWKYECKWSRDAACRVSMMGRRRTKLERSKAHVFSDANGADAACRPSMEKTTSQLTLFCPLLIFCILLSLVQEFLFFLS